ncbi:MAG: hypothetical protein IJ561_07815 [Ruminococcus sp.]|nr:hypothetical protein [Ruminococcus sp.]
MKALQDDYRILPDEELRDIYKGAKKARRFLSYPMLFSGAIVIMNVIDLLLSLLHDLRNPTAPVSVIKTGNLFSLVGAVAGFVGTSAVLTEDLSLNFKLFVSSVTVQILALSALTFAADVQGVAVLLLSVMVILTITANLLARPVIQQLAELKKHPRFPFNNALKDENYIHRVTADEAVRYIENTINKGKVQTIGGEEFFEGEAKAFEKARFDPEKNLQQRKQVWRPHDKSDTSYTMDNLKNMYLGDASQNGELSSGELEKLLWAETAPKKPKEPPPEDFFQSAPIVWRKNKDGSTTIEHCAPGSTPAGETESRAVLP